MFYTIPQAGIWNPGENLYVHKCISAWQPAWGLVGRSQVASLSAAGQVSMLFSLPPHVWNGRFKPKVKYKNLGFGLRPELISPTQLYQFKR